jgi:indole-3-glycerol phosphate synthase
LDLAALRRAAEDSPIPRDFLAALQKFAQTNAPSLIAELKRASPSKGVLAADLDLFAVAEIYAANGAAAISVLTDRKFFRGQIETLRELRFTRQIALPLLRKEFIIDEAQIYEARANGADAILLIAAALPDDSHFAELHACAQSLGITALVETHDAAEIERSLRLPGINLIGINNRNLATFEVSLETSVRLRPLIPAGITVVAESAIFSHADVARLSQAGLDAILVGEALMTAADIAARVRELSSRVA